MAGAVVTGGGETCCDITAIGASIIAADATESAARIRLMNRLIILLHGFCYRSNEGQPTPIGVAFRLSL